MHYKNINSGCHILYNSLHLTDQPSFLIPTVLTIKIALLNIMRYEDWPEEMVLDLKVYPMKKTV